MAKPNYASLLAQIAAETDPAIKANLVAQCYVFPEALTEEEKQLFEYCNTDYIESNPGIVGNAFASYVGKYYNDQGEET